MKRNDLVIPYGKISNDLIIDYDKCPVKWYPVISLVVLNAISG